MTRWVLTRSRVIFVLSADDSDLIERRHLADPQRLREIPPLFAAPDLPDRNSARNRFGIAQDEKAVLWIGRLEQEKDPATFVAALCQSPTRAVGLIVGDGSLRAELEATCERCSNRFIFTGWLADPAPAYAAADLYVNTSLWEVGPLTAFEAASAGLPLILSDCPGAASRLLVQQRVTFPAGDPTGLERLVVKLLAQPRPSTQESVVPVTTGLSAERVVAQITRGYTEALQHLSHRAPTTKARL